ncbi:hypothetical protein Tco_0738271 [Tanacetum coccineum]
MGLKTQTTNQRTLGGVDLPVVLEVFSFGALVDSGSFPALLDVFRRRQPMLCRDFFDVLRRSDGGGRIVADKRGGSTIVVTKTSTSEVDSVLRLNIESIPIPGLGLSMLETKPDDTEELCY